VTPRGAERSVIGGWRRRRLHPDAGLILDLGSGSFPNPAADILVDSELVDGRHRHGLAVVVDRPFVVARAEALPFRAGAFAFVIASHIAEHVEDPDGFCRELSRVARAGYIETPSPLADWALHEDYHIWRVSQRGGVLRFHGKQARSAVAESLTEPIFRAFYAGRTDCSRRTYRLPSGPVGRAASWVLRAFGAALARLGVVHTSYVFHEGAPLRWVIQQARGR
jgi:hypothetical protein